MSRRAQIVVPAGGDSGDDGRTGGEERDAPARRPNFSGDLDTVVGTAPVFRRAVRGYDPLQVDNYVAWIETELTVARRRTEETAAELGPCLAELELSRRLLALSPEGRMVAQVSERMQEILGVAADEAAGITGAAAAEAEQILGRARLECEATLRRAHEIKDAALAESDRVRAEAQAVLDGARTEGQRLLLEAQQRRDRLDADAAAERRHLAIEAAALRERLDAESSASRNHAMTQAVQQLEERREQFHREWQAGAEQDAQRKARVQREVEALLRQRDTARQSLQALNERVGAALEALTGGDGGDVVVLADAS